MADSLYLWTLGLWLGTYSPQLRRITDKSRFRCHPIYLLYSIQTAQSSINLDSRCEQASHTDDCNQLLLSEVGCCRWTGSTKILSFLKPFPTV